MTVTTLSKAEACAVAVKTLGLDAEVLGLSSSEVLTASLLRAASFMCPTGPSQLINAVIEVVQPLVSEMSITRNEVSDLLDLLVGAGDLLELRHEIDGRWARLIYLGPPSYIEREPGSYLLMGVRPFGAALLDGDLLEAVEHEGHTRTIRLEAVTANETLEAAGLQRIERETWIVSPRAETSAEHIEGITLRLNSADRGGEIEGLQFIDPDTSATYYRGRWRAPQSTDIGDFVSRRPQVYGADLWCTVRMENGAATKILQFPVEDRLVPARDEAWRLQMAIDAQHGSPQRYSVEKATSAGANIVRFFSPIPGFAERYLQLVGLPLAETPGALFAFRVPDGAMHGLTRLLAEMLWMESVPKEMKL